MASCKLFGANEQVCKCGFAASKWEATARLDFLWRLQAQQEVEDMRDLREHNECLLYNILPVHVARHFLDRSKNDEVKRNLLTSFKGNLQFIGQSPTILCFCRNRMFQELYSQSYDEVGVMFASIAGFNEYFEQKEIKHEGVDCLRLLNEIIAGFDEVSVRLLTPGHFQTCVSKCCFRPAVGGVVLQLCGEDKDHRQLLHGRLWFGP